MSAAHPSLFTLHDQAVLGELLHSLSQPLTSLRCSLELSLDEATERQPTAVGLALEQTEKVIGMIRLMREYLDADQPALEARRVTFDLVLRSMVEDLAPIGELQEINLHLEGSCSATVPLAESRLRLALQYLIATLIEAAGPGNRIVLRLEEGSTESALRAAVEGILPNPKVGSPHPQGDCDSIRSTLRTVKLAIARRLLNVGGTLLAFDDGTRPGFVLRIPRMLAASRALV